MSDAEKPDIPSLRDLVVACKSQAKDLVAGARSLLDAKLPHLSYHLSALALEEIGKIHLLIMQASADEMEEDRPFRRHLDDHVKKLFWALWGASFRTGKVSGEEIEQNLGLANAIHERRLAGLYVDPDREDWMQPRDYVSAEKAENILTIAEARLGMEESVEIDFSPDPLVADNARWFLDANDDPEKRRLILGGPSIKKLNELRHPAEWVAWLREQFREAEAQGRRMAEEAAQESHERGGADAEPRWRFTMRLLSDSHSIRSSFINAWNDSSWIKLQLLQGTKNELLVQMTLPKEYQHIGDSWQTGFEIARRLAASFCIGTGGLFWWYLPPKQAAFFATVTDLKKRADAIVADSRPVGIPWANRALKDKDGAPVWLCLHQLPRPEGNKALFEALERYLAAIAILCKNDVHARLESSAFSLFGDSLANAMRAQGEWDGTTTIAEALARIPETPAMPDFVRDVLLKWERIRAAGNPQAADVTVEMEDVARLKHVCEMYWLGFCVRAEKAKPILQPGPNGGDGNPPGPSKSPSVA